MDLAKLLVAHAIITFAAGVVLIVAPGLIPSAVGIRLEPGAYLLAFLLAGAELGLATLSYYAKNLGDAEALRAVVLTFIVFHAPSAVLEVYAFAQGVGAAIWGNVIARIVISALFVYYGFVARRPTPSPSSG